VPTAELDNADAAERVQRAKTDAARARLEQAQAEVEKIRPEFDKREVRAPFDGVVIQRMVEPGTSVSASSGWFSVAEMTSTEIYVETDENNLGRLKVGQPATAVAPAYPDRPFRARLTQVGPNVDSERGVVGLRLVADKLPDFVLPNMTIDVNIEVQRADNALALPAGAVSFQGRPHVLALGAHVHAGEKIAYEIGGVRTRFEQSPAVVGPSEVGPLAFPSGFTVYTVRDGVIDAGRFVPIEVGQ